jgi:hypothetical protein
MTRRCHVTGTSASKLICTLALSVSFQIDLLWDCRRSSASPYQASTAYTFTRCVARLARLARLSFDRLLIGVVPRLELGYGCSNGQRILRDRTTSSTRPCSIVRWATEIAVGVLSYVLSRKVCRLTFLSQSLGSVLTEVYQT